MEKQYKILYKGKKIDVCEASNKFEALKKIMKRYRFTAVVLKK